MLGTGLTDFLLNKKEPEKQDVASPTFSIIKVLTSAGVIVAPLATLVVDWTTKVNLSEGQYITLALGLLAFIAVLASSDVLGRSYVAGQKAKASATRDAAKKRTQLKAFAHPVPGHTDNIDVKVLAELLGENAYLANDDHGVPLVVSKDKLEIG